MMSIPTLLPFALAWLAFSSGSMGHVFKFGTCPRVDVVDGFNFTQFQGRWYAIEKSRTASSCMRYDFVTNVDGSVEVRERYRLFGFKIFDWNEVSQVGQLTVPKDDSPAKMTVRFPFSLNPFAATSFWVTSTDYERYAAVWSCSPLPFGNLQSGMILSRNRTLDAALVHRLRSRLDFFGVDVDDFTRIDQEDCDDDVGPSSTPEAGPASEGTTTSATNATETSVTPDLDVSPDENMARSLQERH